ncbi:MAG: ferritin family protein [candidate division KSB1 bacterium]|nr:ferritin family protein [candidate division KSB1 bacterium]
MANLFLASEIVAMNVTEERNGYEFYKALASSAKSSRLREAAERIAQQEKRHEERFRKWLTELEPHHSVESYPGEYDAYVRALLRNRTFPDDAAARKMATEAQSDLQAVELALQMEKNTLLLLQELRKHCPEQDLAFVDATVREEEDHLIELTEIREQLAS